ncbi:MAG: hypothetical protein K2P64_08545 [Lachnospiraceae bacterium]|nr:hypothetical protein [Lachnospiraceae bacterium]
MTYSVMLPYSSVNILGATVTTGNVLTMANIFAVGTTFVNLMFQVDDVSMFVKGQKELGEPTGNQYYDYAKKDFEILAYNIGMFAAANPRMYGDAKDTYRQIGQDMGIRGNSDKRIGEIKVEFSYNSKYDKTEFERQLAEQEEGMNKLTVQEYLDNRQKYIEQGRSIESNAAQQAAREKAFLDKVDELQNTGLSLKEAEKQAQKWIDTQAALHNPDQIAGGRASSIGGVGDKAINSSIGSQWRYRINDVDEQIKKMIENMSEAERKSTYLNVNLVRKGG